LVHLLIFGDKLILELMITEGSKQKRPSGLWCNKYRELQKAYGHPIRASIALKEDPT
jgi:hypothetical protein